MPRKPRRPKIQLQCLECKTTFMESVAYYELRGRKFCGRKCHSAYLERENTLEKAFLNHIKKSNEPDGCWVWTAAQTSTGYGLMGFRGKMIKTHRASWMIYRGEIPKGMFVCHSCDLNYPTGDTSYRLCCNPHHLWLGTNQENVDDMIQKKRHAHGKQASYSKLTEEQAIQIKRLLAEDKLSQDKIARQFGITRSNVLNIKLGNAWKHVGTDIVIEKKAPRPKSGLTDDQVLEIYRLVQSGEKTTHVARLFNASPGVVTSIKLGLTWRRVTQTHVNQEALS